MLEEFSWWWVRQMRALLRLDLLPEANRGGALVVEAEPPYVALTWQRRGRDALIGRFRMDEPALAGAVKSLPRPPRRVVLRVSPDMLLERAVELPLPAERELDRVLGYEMDRLTPFTVDEVVWHASVTRRDHAQRTLLLRLAFVPRAVLRPMLDALAKSGLAVDWLHATARDGTLRRFSLARASQSRSARRAITILAGAVAALAMAVIVTPFVTQSLARSATERAIAELGPRVAKVEGLRKRLAEGAAGTDALTAERARTGDVLQVLSAITEILPDGTWLSEFSLHQGKLSCSGQSPAAAQLIPALAADPGFRNPAFAAPVTRAPDGHNDLFVIRAELAS